MVRHRLALFRYLWWRSDDLVVGVHNRPGKGNDHSQGKTLFSTFLGYELFSILVRLKRTQIIPMEGLEASQIIKLLKSGLQPCRPTRSAKLESELESVCPAVL